MQAKSNTNRNLIKYIVDRNDKYTNLSKCRCCLTPGIHHCNFGRPELKMVMEILNVSLMADQSFPRLLCIDCVTSLKEVQRFRQKVMESEATLRQAMTKDINPESIEQFQTDPLEISHVKVEQDLSVHSSTDDDDDDDNTAESGDCNEVKIKLEPCEETTKDNKSKSSVETENEKGSNKSNVKSLEKELQPKRTHMVPQSSKELRLQCVSTIVPINSKTSGLIPINSKTSGLVPINSKTSGLVPINSKTSGLIPINSKTSGLIPINSKTSGLIPINSKTSGLVPINNKTSGLAPINNKILRLVPQSSKGLRLVPINGEGSGLVNSEDLRLIPHTSKGLHLVPINNLRLVPKPGKGLLCVPITDVSTNANNEKGKAIILQDRKRRIEDEKSEIETKRKKSNSESDVPEIFEANKKKIDVKDVLARLESSRNLLRRENKNIRSNIILILKHSTVVPFRNNFKSAFKCFYCDKLCIYFKDLKHHMETEHNNISEATISETVKKTYNLIVTADISCIKCRICDEELKSIDVLVEHLCSVHKKIYHNTDKKPSHGILGFDLSTDALKCHICNKIFPFFKNLSMHMNDHYGSIVCYVCGKMFLSEHRYKCHVFKAHADKDTKCKHCGKVFSTEPSKAYHVQKEHLKRLLKCPKCPETFPFGQYVKKLNHMAEAHGIKKPVFKCDTCGREYAYSGSLAAHKRYDHKRTKEHKCDICGYITVHNTVMKKHMDVHNGVKNYECEFCKKKFAKLYTLKLHLKIHLNDKRFVCTLCDAAFIQKNSLKSHLKSRHPDSGIDISKL